MAEDEDVVLSEQEVGGEERFIELDVRQPSVIVSDNEADLEELEMLAVRLLDDVVEAHDDLSTDDSSPTVGVN